VKRREFIKLLGGALAAQAIPANAQELRVRTVGVLMGLANDAETKARVKAFEQGLEREGWSSGQNLRIEYRYAEGDSVRMQALAKELVELKPDCILGHSTPVVTALMQATRTIPNRVRVRIRSGRQRIRCEHSTTCRQHDWVHDLSGHHYRQIPIDAERNGTAARPRGHPLQSGYRASRGHILFDPIH
jgi:hypothetical protein